MVITELKINRSADEALRQISDKGYAEKYLRKGQDVILFGVNIKAKEGSKLVMSWKENRL